MSDRERVAREHELKTWPVYFAHILDGTKMFEVRKDDRGFHEGDGLLLREWDPDTEHYTGREARRTIGYIFRDGSLEAVHKGWAILSLTGGTEPDRLIRTENVCEACAINRPWIYEPGERHPSMDAAITALATPTEEPSADMDGKDHAGRPQNTDDPNDPYFGGAPLSAVREALTPTEKVEPYSIVLHNEDLALGQLTLGTGGSVGEALDAAEEWLRESLRKIATSVPGMGPEPTPTEDDALADPTDYFPTYTPPMTAPERPQTDIVERLIEACDKDNDLEVRVTHDGTGGWVVNLYPEGGNDDDALTGDPGWTSQQDAEDVATGIRAEITRLRAAAPQDAGLCAREKRLFDEILAEVPVAENQRLDLEEMCAIVLNRLRTHGAAPPEPETLPECGACGEEVPTGFLTIPVCDEDCGADMYDAVAPEPEPQEPSNCPTCSGHPQDNGQCPFCLAAHAQAGNDPVEFPVSIATEEPTDDD